MLKLIKWLLPFIMLVAGIYVGQKYLGGAGGYTDEPIAPSSNPLFEGASSSSLASETGGSGAVHEVRDGESIQDAVTAAAPGDRINVYPGTYTETVFIDKDSITLSGVIIEGDRPVLDGGGELNDAVLYSGHNIIIENFEIRHYKGNGVMGQAGNNFVVRNNIIDDAGVYGIFPQFGTNGLISHNVLSRISDAAIYVGMSDNIDVVYNEVFANVAGIEIENTRHALVEGNLVYDNTGGILVFITPGLPIKTTFDVIVRNNFVVDNNHENFGEPGSIVSYVPAGTGIMVMAGDDVVIENNIIRGNNSMGILVTSLDILDKTSGDPDSEPNSDHVTILDNMMVNNGSDPAPIVQTLLMSQFKTGGIDIIDTGKGEGKCILNASRYKTLLMSQYAQCNEAEDSTRAIRTMTLAEPAAGFAYEGAELEGLKDDLGKRTYFAVCSGCHAYDIRLIGPPVTEIKGMYYENPQGMAQWIASPQKRRPNYPEMPPQNYLSEETLLAVSEFILKLDK